MDTRMHKVGSSCAFSVAVERFLKWNLAFESMETFVG